MATYKQRTPYQRHPAAYSDDENSHPPAPSAAVKHSSAAHSTTNTAHLHNSHHGNYQHQPGSSLQIAEDDIVENTSDREWTSIRNSTTTARAKARQQQYIDQQQQRTREWQFVLAQHHHRPSFLPSASTTNKDISSDEYDDILSGTEAPSVVINPCIADTIPGTVAAGSAGEQSSFFGYSDLTSDGLESVGGSEDLGVWSHEDDEDAIPVFRRLPPLSPPLAASSTTTSLSHIPRPSFAAGPYTQNQMPFHDGSGNFAGAQSGRSHLESDNDSDRGWDSSSSRASSLLRQYRAKSGTTRRRISSTEFRAVIQNIADLQHTSPRQARVRSRSRPRSVDGLLMPPTDSHLPRFIYPSVVTSRPIFNIYESEMEDMADMSTEVPTKIGWLQAIDQALRAMNHTEYEANVSDPSLLSPIKALAQSLTPEELSTPSVAASTTSASSDGNASSATQSIEPTLSDDYASEQVKQNMAEASLETMKRLQTRKRSNPHQRYGADPIQVDFSPTMRDRPMYDSGLHRDRRVMSRSTGTSTSTHMRNTNLLAVVLSTLRRFRDHVQSNLHHADFYDEEDRHADLARSLGFDGSLGIGWSMGTDPTATGVDENDRARSVTRDQRDRHRERASSVASTVSRTSSHQSIGRVGSDCRLESMWHYKGREARHSIHASHRPNLVE
ncbi:hypothetical protein BGZ99_003452 [Dissophora globulifera]|uniref:Uncharacterized protein n=1 Tax=Dissophora globulifera TaxID=979702 RepID=A0A9P6RL58_9FUNG|nr:hypothetical protein BGZ99_003452 [Dissophora globulifera]